MTEGNMAAVSDLAWRSFRGFLEGPGRLIFPQHTREAIFQLSCDLRTNVPKNRKWAYQHGQALKPHSLPGWIAVGSFAFGALSISSLASSALLLTSLGLAGFVTAIASLIGVFVGFWMLVISGVLFGSTFFLAAVSAGFAAGYVTVTTLLNIARFGQNVVQRVIDSQGGLPKQRAGGARQLFADESIQMKQSPKSSITSLTGASSSGTTDSNKTAKNAEILEEPSTKLTNEQSTSEKAAIPEELTTSAKPANGKGPWVPDPTPNGHRTEVPASKTPQARQNGTGSVANLGEDKHKKSFAEIQEDLKNFPLRPDTSGQAKSSGKRKAADSPSSGSSSISTTFGYNGTTQPEGKPNSGSEMAALAGNLNGSSNTSSTPQQMDLSPGRAEAQHFFSDLQKAAKGVTEEESRPESGPSVQGKFAEAVHPKLLGMEELNANQNSGAALL